MAWRDVVLRAEKLTAEVAVEKGIINSAHASVEDTMKAALRLREELVSRKWDGHVYAQNRKHKRKQSKQRHIISDLFWNWRLLKPYKRQNSSLLILLILM
ncbi:hypothetical protein F0562_020827 [Nyssa sinensis]|uniref:Uncharacterized protein n=1 Tax=Nyssa sinensis TaxID=561372 RepID=A0A5J5BVW3_9ASTE|nr:hypothetical protein F0562_020827 [Nyssa sinensis]